jgi:hypothetical protein
MATNARKMARKGQQWPLTKWTNIEHRKGKDRIMSKASSGGLSCREDGFLAPAASHPGVRYLGLDVGAETIKMEELFRVPPEVMLLAGVQPGP